MPGDVHTAIVAAVAPAEERERRGRLEVERRLLAGENRVEVRSPLGYVVVFEVPAWRQRPIARLRVEVARHRARRRR